MGASLCTRGEDRESGNEKDDKLISEITGDAFSKMDVEKEREVFTKSGFEGVHRNPELKNTGIVNSEWTAHGQNALDPLRSSEYVPTMS